MRLSCLAGVLALSAMVSGCAERATPSGAAFAFVLLGEGADGVPVPMVRTIAEGATACPRLEVASRAPTPLTERSRPPSGGFDDVLVCEARYPVGLAASVVVNGRRLLLPAVSLSRPRRVMVLGDSGCDDSHKKPLQECDSLHSTSWPFAELAREADIAAPDLFVHVGDYNYRGTPQSIKLPPSVTGYAQDLEVDVYDVGDIDEGPSPRAVKLDYWSQNVPGSPHRDSWPAWRDDFFAPAHRLLPMAPWVFTRGNHELCSRAGPGWFYLLDSGSALLGPGKQQAACPPQLPDDWRPGAWPPQPAQPFARHSFPNPTTPPARLKLGELNLIVVDSSTAADAFPDNVALHTEQYRAVAHLLADRTPTWIVTHRPIWGVVLKEHGQPAPDAPYGFINITQQKAVASVFPDGLPAHVTALLAGHTHRFQAIGFQGRRPPQIIVGTGGVELHDVTPQPSPDDPLRPVPVPNLDGVDAWVVGLKDFGMLVIEPRSDGTWTGFLMTLKRRILATCDSQAGRRRGLSVCALRPVN
jgi:hypothetical protein